MSLDTCLAGNQLIYRYGKTNGPDELYLVRHVREVGMTPWPGVGHTFWEDFTVYNQGYGYTVYYSFDRDADVREISAGLSVGQGEFVIAERNCEAGSLEFSGTGFPLYDAKVSAGQVWAYEKQVWVDKP